MKKTCDLSLPPNRFYFIARQAASPDMKAAMMTALVKTRPGHVEHRNLLRLNKRSRLTPLLQLLDSITMNGFAKRWPVSLVPPDNGRPEKMAVPSDS
jgi:hypothetical protein